jgi:predicted lipoprotein with Yx(FWY)xxD motif
VTRLATLSVIGLLAVAACGGADEEEPASGSAATATATPTPTTTASPEPDSTPAPIDRKGTRIVLADSEFGPMLYNASKQAIYIFQNDEKNTSNCYDECAEAWPPVFTKGEPDAGKGVNQSLLGTIKRRDGRNQITYAGQPLYYYVNEGPGQVLCHNVHLNGGLWWVVGANGKRLD